MPHPALHKILFSALVVGALFFISGTPAHAVIGPEPAPASSNTTIAASSTQGDEDAEPSSAQAGALRCVVCGAPVKKAVKLSGPVLVQKKFVTYLTGSWAKSTGYSWSSATTVGATVSAGLGISATSASNNIGVAASVTKTYSITINIAASSSRFSKLGLASNYNKYGVKTAWYQDGKVVPGASWSYGDLYSPTKDQYLIVYYQ
ncbi:hypothetical protein [Microbacterium sp. NPDC089695]|uniref:hypothetical protein n=1 Tax=Microbacterium sp. NPDC089695 TaxID=3364198 RepID=UPI0037F34975